MQEADAMSSSSFPLPYGLQPEIVATAIPDDERVWVPQAENVWFRPLLFNTVSGGWCNLLRVRKSGVLSRHRHPMVVVGYVIKGRWFYREHDWVANAGDFVYEPPGETHTLEVPADCAEMITFFNISGAMIYLDEQGRQTAYEDVFTKIEMCRAHYESTGLGADYVDRFMR
jgi:quercetin dioxygenase-like cupin family protein